VDCELTVYSRWGIELISGSGCYVTDSEGRRYLDLYGGHAVASTGHCHPKVVEAIKDQCDKILFYSNMVDFRVRRELAARLTEMVPGAASAFFVNSGAEANEAALALARMITGRRKIVAFADGFHGRTLGVLSACGMEKHRARTVIDGRPMVADVELVPFGSTEALEEALSTEVAAVIGEPVQGLAGALDPPDGFWTSAVELTHAAGAMFIFDEVQTGVGRLGSFTGASKYGVTLDMVTLAKGLGSGFPISAVLVSEEISGKVKPGDLGTTFGGGPLACAAALATLEVVVGEGLVQNAASCELFLREQLHDLPGVRRVQGAGLLLGIVLEGKAGPVIGELRNRGLLVGSAFDERVIRLTPPLIVTHRELEQFVGELAEVLKK